MCWLRTSELPTGHRETENTQNPNRWLCGKTNGCCGSQLAANIRAAASDCASQSDCWLALSFQSFVSSQACHLSFHVYLSVSHLLYRMSLLLLSFFLSSGILYRCPFLVLSSTPNCSEVPPFCHFTVGPPKCPSVLFPLSYPPPLTSFTGCCEDWWRVSNCST